MCVQFVFWCLFLSTTVPSRVQRSLDPAMGWDSSRLTSTLSFYLRGRTSLPYFSIYKVGRKNSFSVGLLAAGQTALRPIKLDLCFFQTLRGLRDFAA